MNKEVEVDSENDPDRVMAVPRAWVFPLIC